MRLILILLISLLFSAGVYAQTPTDVARSLNRAGTTQFQTGQYEAAIESFEQAINAAPGNFQAYINLGSAYIQLKQYGNAKQALQWAVTLAPSNANALNQPGVVHFETGQDAHAIKNFIASLRLAPNDVHANYNLVRPYVRTKNYREAILLLDKAREIEPDIHLYLGYAHYLQKSYRVATDETQIAVRLAPDDDQGQLLLATLYRKTAEKLSRSSNTRLLKDPIQNSPPRSTRSCTWTTFSSLAINNVI